MEQTDIRSHKIMQMEPEKRDRIINAALAEFRNGFKKASTDAVVREAGVSKGLLFHYFGTKEGLYEFLLWYSMDVMEREFTNLINYGERDILERLKQMTLLKLDLGIKYYALSDFMLTAYTLGRDDPTDRFSDVFQSTQMKLMQRLYENIDYSLFDEGIDPQKALHVIQWTLQGYSNSKINRDTDYGEHLEKYEGYMRDIDGYFSLLRHVFYKRS